MSQTPAELPICLEVGSVSSICNEPTWVIIQGDSCITQATSTSNKYPPQQQHCSVLVETFSLASDCVHHWRKIYILEAARNSL